MCENNSVECVALRVSELIPRQIRERNELNQIEQITIYLYT